MNSRFRLFATPSLFTGAARLVDLGGVFDKYNRSQTEAEADSKALLSDWTTVGWELETALDQVHSDLVGPLRERSL